MTPGQFTCRKCGGVFGDDLRGKRGRNICRSCANAESRRWRAENHERHAETTRIQRATFQQRNGISRGGAWARRNWSKAAIRRANERAKEVGVPADITPHDIRCPAVCPVLGFPLAINHGRGRNENSPSLDKVIPSLGYTQGNVCVISHRSNKIKSDATPDEILSVALYAYTATGHTLPDIHAKVNEIAQRQVEYAKINAGTETVGDYAQPDLTQPEAKPHVPAVTSDTCGACVCSVNSKLIQP